MLLRGGYLDMKTQSAQRTPDVDSSMLSGEDARELLRLSNRLHALPNDRVLRTRSFLEAFCELTNADVAICAQLVDFCPDVPIPTHVWGIDHGFKEEERAAFFASLRDLKANMHPVIDACRKYHTRPTAFRREDLIGDDAWYGSDFFKLYASPAGVDHIISPVFPLAAPNSVIGTGVMRRHGRPRFSEREQLLVHTFNAELGWFYESIAAPPQRATPGGQVAPLRPRLKRTLEHLLAGQSEKQVARTLGLTRDTVHQYVKEIYKHFDVSSRAELLARVLPDSANRPAPDDRGKTPPI